VAGVLAAGELRLFVNGKRVGTLKTTKKLMLGPLPWIDPEGKGTGRLGREFFGTIREVRISNSARYDADFTPAKRLRPDADTLALYHCDEETGDVLTDSSGHKRHGKIIGAKWVKLAEPKAIDLLKLIDPKKHAVEGLWRFDGQTLVTPSGSESWRRNRLQIPMTIAPQESYELAVVITRQPGSSSSQQAIIGLVVGDSRTIALLDVVAGKSPMRSGLYVVDGKVLWGHVGQVLPVGKQVQVVCKVSKDSVVITCDEKQIVTWKGDAKKSLACGDVRWEMPNPRQLFIGSYGGGTGFHITKLEIRPSTPTGATK
jgi:hypothetical protein